jgi:hypothetical protein
MSLNTCRCTHQWSFYIKNQRSGKYNLFMPHNNSEYSHFLSLCNQKDNSRSARWYKFKYGWIPLNVRINPYIFLRNSHTWTIPSACGLRCTRAAIQLLGWKIANFAEGGEVRVFCVFCTWRPLRRANHSIRGVLPQAHARARAGVWVCV